MFKNIRIPLPFSLIEKGKVSILLKDEYKNLLLRQGIEDLKTFLLKSTQTSRYLKGRTLHPSIPLGDGRSMVLRQYSHGGLLQSITGNLYFFGMRSFQELTLTEEIRSCGIPTIISLGAIHHRIFFPFYQAYFLTLEIPHAKDLTQYFQEIGSQPSRENLLLKRKTIRLAGILIHQFHQAGFFHGDLQLKNILVNGDQVLLIDFDRSYRKSALSIQERMRNLLRLNRSAEKWKYRGLPITRTDRWRFFLAYAGEDQKIREATKRAIRTYSIRSFFYRLGWAVGRVLGVQGPRVRAEENPRPPNP